MSRRVGVPLHVLDNTQSCAALSGSENNEGKRLSSTCYVSFMTHKGESSGVADKEEVTKLSARVGVT